MRPHPVVLVQSGPHHPRDRGRPEAAAQPARPGIPRLVEKIYVAMTARAPAAPRIGAAAGTVATRSTRSCRASPPTCCPACSKRSPAEPYKGQADLPVIADELHLEGGRAVPGRGRVADAALRGDRRRRHQADRCRPAIRRRRNGQSQADVPAPASHLRAARRAYPPRAAGARQPRRAEKPLLRRTGRPHGHRRCRGDAALGDRMGALRRSVRLRR